MTRYCTQIRARLRWYRHRHETPKPALVCRVYPESEWMTGEDMLRALRMDDQLDLR